MPTYQLLAHAANPALMEAIERAPVVVAVDRADCSLQFDPVGTTRFTSACDIARRALANAGVSYRMERADPQSVAQIRVGDALVATRDAHDLDATAVRTIEEDLARRLRAALDSAGYPQAAEPASIRLPLVLLGLLLLVVPAAAIFGPIGAALVELFPTQVRYTAMSLPYHIGTGWFGGFMPAIAFAIVTQTGNMFSGLFYVMALAAIALVVALTCWREQHGRDLAA